MRELELVIGNKNYSSWSLRAWLVLKHADVSFRETVIPLAGEDSIRAKLDHSPTGRVPVLHDGETTVWDSLAIAEYVAEHFPEATLWPEDAVARARARAITAEMHAGFEHLRRELPMNCRARRPRRERSPGVAHEITRILECWHSTRRNFGGDGPYLFGSFSIADAFFAPVASRFFTYDVEVDDNGAEYLDTLFSIPAMQRWMCDAESEEMVISAYDAIE